MKQLLLDLNKLGVKLRLDGEELRVHAPPGALDGALRSALRENRERIIAQLRAGPAVNQALPRLVADPEQRARPFPLTDLQHAYWLGRDSAMEMGNVATHLYLEFDCEHMSVERLNQALCRMIARHDMLRAVVGGDGMQRILPEVPRYRIAARDCSAASAEAAGQAVLETRSALSHQVLKADQWPLFDIRATVMPAERVRLHVSLDLLILDARSIFLFFKEWHQLYVSPDTVPEKFELSFREYVLAEHGLRQSDAHRRAHAYWMARIGTLPAAPDLPLRSDLSARQSPRFSRRAARLEKSRWEKFRTRALEQGLTPSGLLLAAYAEVLARWSSAPHFTVNVTLSQRLPMHAEVDSLLGEFTSLIMHEVDMRDGGTTFLERARSVRRQFMDDMDHREFNGVAVMREWARRRGGVLQATMPVVFSSGLIWRGDETPGDLEQFGEKVHSISQTSQVWLDFQTMEIDGDLVLYWDAADAVFEDGVLDAMFVAYRDLIERLADDEGVWSARDVVALPAAMQRRREEANDTAAPLPQRRLHAGFVERALRDPGAVAVLAPERTLRYGDLLAESCAVADWLSGAGLRAGEPVAVVMRKGWEQIVAVYGVLLAGGAYMPVDADLPVRRQLELLRIGQVRQALTQAGAARDELDTGEWRFKALRAGERGSYGAAHARSLDGALDQLAYVIFTSGTSGVPKGVMIDHRGAANTVLHINALHGVAARDRVLAVSSLSFDLSVYDIFGLLDAGGAVVIPDYRKGHDPIHWRDLIVQHRVTVWNSAPQLMRMLMDCFFDGEEEEAPLRIVLMSGDFIPLDLPGRIRQRYTGASVISLGGATEASIWSNHYPVHGVSPEWVSIPYGKALPNQTIWVCDHALRPCPDHVRGQIYIGGSGLAAGYWGDAEKTRAHFIRHPVSAERLYATGDLGRYAADGNIVILGRDDGQIKLRGHRVELGEIEAVLRRHAAVRQAVVVASGGAESRQLVAYAACGAADADPQALKDYLAERLPDYMVPRSIVVLERMPLSPNGKIDYKALPSVADEPAQGRAERVLPRNAVEQTIFDAWSRVIPGVAIGVTDNFFELGGDSVVATALVRELNACMPALQMEMHELFENLSVEELALLYQSRGGAGGRTGAAAGLASDPPPAMLADVAAAVAELDRLDFGAAPAPAAALALLVTGGTGWIGAHLLAELLAATDATLYCLVRAGDQAQGRRRLIDGMRRHGIELDPSSMARVEAVCGDLSAPGLGLNGTDWNRLARSVDAIYHFGASVNVLADYPSHRKVNVAPLASLVRLAAEHRLKPVFCGSPMAVCRRQIGGRLVVLSGECAHADPNGLLSPYAQSKWAAEQVLLAAAQRGLPVTIYRSSHALPSARSGRAKPGDTYGSVLRVAREAGVVPDWDNASMHGVPVDTLAHLLVEHSLAPDQQQRVVHLENRDPLALRAVVAMLLAAAPDDAARLPRVPLDEWKARCIEAADRMADTEAALARQLFVQRGGGSAVEDMFSHHLFDTHHFERRGHAAKLSALTPPDYWRTVAGNAEY